LFAGIFGRFAPVAFRRLAVQHSIRQQPRRLLSQVKPYKPLIDPQTQTSLSAKQVYERLINGHKKFLNAEHVPQNVTSTRRVELGQCGQFPMATVLCCSDSRSDPALLFNCGLGDLFVIRVAGHIPAQDQVASCEFALKHVGTPLLVVLGHSQCAAVHAAVMGVKLSSNIERLVLKMKPLADMVRAKHPEATWLEVENMAIRENVIRCVGEVLAQSAVIRELIREEKAMIVGGVYDMESGNIEWIDEKPIVNRALADGGRQWKLLTEQFKPPALETMRGTEAPSDTWRGLQLENGHSYEIGEAIGYLTSLGVHVVLDADRKILLVPSNQTAQAIHALTK